MVSAPKPNVMVFNLLGTAGEVFISNTFKEAKFNPDKSREVFKEISQSFSGSSENHISDKKQLSECIASEIEYFVTTDKNILGAYEELLQKFNV